MLYNIDKKKTQFKASTMLENDYAVDIFIFSLHGFTYKFSGGNSYSGGVYELNVIF